MPTVSLATSSVARRGEGRYLPAVQRGQRPPGGSAPSSTRSFVAERERSGRGSALMASMASSRPSETQRQPRAEVSGLHRARASAGEDREAAPRQRQQPTGPRPGRWSNPARPAWPPMIAAGSAARRPEPGVEQAGHCGVVAGAVDRDLLVLGCPEAAAHRPAGTWCRRSCGPTTSGRRPTSDRTGRRAGRARVGWSGHVSADGQR